MTEQQYQTIWEEGQGEQPVRIDGDRTHYWDTYGAVDRVHVTKIERRVPNVSDMEPGTTFTAIPKHDTKPRRFMVTTLDLTDHRGEAWSFSAVDPTTIRDVQAPPAMPKGDAS